MNKAFKLLIPLLMVLPSMAQNSDSSRWDRFINLYENPYKNFEAAKILSYESSAILSTNRVSNNFIYPFIFGKKLERKVIDQNLDRNKNVQLNAEINQSLKFINLEKSLFKNPNLNGYIKAGTHSRTFVNATNGAMRLVFDGNSDTTPYPFGNCNYYRLKMNKIGGGVFYHSEKAPKPFNLSFGLFATQAVDYGKINTYERNYLHGNVDSFELGINYDAEFASVTPFSNGLGVSSELIFNQKLEANKNWGFKLDNFGFVNYANSVNSYTAYGVYKFDGFYISDIGAIRDKDYFKNQLDSFTNPLTNKQANQTKTIWMAPTSHIYFNFHKSSGYYQIGLRHTGTPSLPVAELRYFKFIYSKLMMGATIGAIGQTYLNTDINWALGRQWFFQASVYHLESLILPKTFGGLGGNFGLQFVF